MKNKKKLGFLCAAIATAFAAGCSDEVTNADRSFSDDRDYYVPFIPGIGIAGSVVFESDTTVIDGVSYLDCENLNPDAVYVTLKYGDTDNWVIAEAINGGSFCVATTGSAGMVDGQGAYYHFIPDSSGGADLAKLKQDALVDGGNGLEYPSLAEALGNDELVSVQETAPAAALSAQYAVLQHPTDPSKNIYKISATELFQPANGLISLDCADCYAVAVLENDNILVARSDERSYRDRFPQAQNDVTSNLALHSSDGSFIDFVPLKFAVSVLVDGDISGRHNANGVWLMGRAPTNNGGLLRLAYSDDSNEVWLDSPLGAEIVPLNPINGSFDGAGNFWIVGSSEGEASIYKHIVDAGGSKVAGFADEIAGASLSLSSSSRLVTGGK